MAEYYDQAFRDELRQVVLANGTAPAAASEIVDLSCHAAEEAVRALRDIALRGSRGPVALAAFEIALQLAAHRMLEIAKRTHDFGASLGATQTEAPVRMPT